MNLIQIERELQGNEYPGRGIILGRSEDNKKAMIAYFIMGRSENSRNRVFIEENGGLRTEAFDPSKMVDPSLIIYWPVRVLSDCTIVTNGDQTDTIYEGLKEGKTWEEALRTREFEPDAPNFTPRISGMVEKGGAYHLSILKSFDGDPACCNRFFYEYEKPQAGIGHFIHTYKQDGNPLPSFEGEPKKVEIKGDLKHFGETVWNSLSAENKVSLFVRSIDLITGETESIIYNKHA